jgi:hypothetical protein
MSKPLTSAVIDEAAPGWGAVAFQTLIEKMHRDREEWIGICEKVLVWHRLNCVLNDATPHDAKSGEAALTWLLRLSRIMRSTWADPRVSNRAIAEQIESLHWKLEEAWEQTHNDLTEPEAMALSEQYFPGDEQRA